ncbi:stigma-specific STIG1-like protein 1 [Malania oleifera]|uniref:stigma-specific STIG1-like protein 1 n=1 Tax=Malania oleifera TaxID=397392 RepID=UPI0025AEAF8E|nr:stigma-specific STIG1-like protein 1 [Malania oleifera]
MKFLTISFMLLMIMALSITTLFATPNSELEPMAEDCHNKASGLPLTEDGERPVWRRGASRLLAQKTRAVMTCNEYPRVCRKKGSGGPDCCRKQCVNVAVDRLNWGRCGEKCKFSEICCKGVCVNPYSNRKHCGGCNNRCRKGSSCTYGMCSYA